MKYRFKNKELFDALSVIFGKEYLENELQRQMSNDTHFFYIDIDRPDGIKGAVKVLKEDFELTKVYDPNDWNPYPEVNPPEEGYYLVYLTKNKYIRIQVDKYVREEFREFWKNNFICEVLAFRPLNVAPPSSNEYEDED